MSKSPRHNWMVPTRHAARLGFEAQSVTAPTQGACGARKALGCNRRRVRANRRRLLRKT
jgi:hypothetical protein